MLAIRLPFNLAVEGGSAFTMRRSPDPDEPPWVSLSVHRVSIPLRESAVTPYESGLQALLGDSAPDLEQGASMQTWVLSETLNVLFDDEEVNLNQLDNARFFTAIFERTLTAINRLVAAEALITHQPWSRPLAKESLDRDIEVFHADAEGRLSPVTLMHLHDRPYNPVVQSQDPQLRNKVAEAIGKRLASNAALRPHPLVLARELEQRARAYRLAGDYAGAITTLQTAAETYLRGIHRLALVDGGAHAGSIDAAAEQPLKSVIRHALPSLLGGDWSSASSPVSTYVSDLYEVRHRITHAGMAPRWQDLNPAFAAYQALVSFVEGRVRKQPRHLTRTLTALWEPWAGGTLSLSATAQDLVAGVLNEPVPYWLPPDDAGR